MAIDISRALLEAGKADDGETLHLVEEVTAIDLAMNKTRVQFDRFRGDFPRLFDRFRGDFARLSHVRPLLCRLEG